MVSGDHSRAGAEEPDPSFEPLRPSRVRPTAELRHFRDDPETGFVGEDAPCPWWFSQERRPLFLVDANGRLLFANPVGKATLRDGDLAVNGAGVLKFGSSECDAVFLSGVRGAAGKGEHRVAVLRQRNGGWFGAELTGAPTEMHVVVGLRREPTPSPQAMSAIGGAFNLTPSELDVLRCLLVGQCPKSAAMHLGVSEHTVRAHLRSLYAKMNARGLSALIRLSCAFI